MQSRVTFDRSQHTLERCASLQKGKVQLEVCVVPIPKMAVYADTPPDIRNPSDFDDSDRDSQWLKCYPPVRATSPENCRKMVEGFKFPEALRHKAHHLSKELVGILVTEGAAKRVDHMAYGRFDTRAMRRVIKDLHTGKFSRENTRPYYQRQRIAPKPPHVAVVSDGSAAAMWSRASYIPDVAALSLGVQWACEALNCTITTALTRKTKNAYRSNQRPDLLCYIINDQEVTCTFQDMAILFNRDLYRTATMTFFSSHPDTLDIMCHNVRRSGEYANLATQTGGEAVSWARSRGADIVVAIGDVDDYEKADVYINADTKLEDAIREIANKLMALKERKVA